MLILVKANEYCSTASYQRIISGFRFSNVVFPEKSVFQVFSHVAQDDPGRKRLKFDSHSACDTLASS